MKIFGFHIGREPRPQLLLVDWDSSALVELWTPNNVWWFDSPEAALRSVGGEGRIDKFHVLRVGSKHYLTTYLRELDHVRLDAARAKENDNASE